MTISDLVVVDRTRFSTLSDFTLYDGPRPIGGTLWSPRLVNSPLPVVLVGHGAGESRTSRSTRAVAGRISREIRAHVVALDAPGHGETTQPEFVGTVIDADDHRERARRRRLRAQRGASDCRLAMSAALAQGWADGRFGYWGLSMAAQIGMSLLSTEDRIVASVLGLVGQPKNEFGDAMQLWASRTSSPAMFFVQDQDATVRRADALALFDAIGSSVKLLRTNPGGHSELPIAEQNRAVQFLKEHLMNRPGISGGSPSRI